MRTLRKLFTITTLAATLSLLGLLTLAGQPAHAYNDPPYWGCTGYLTTDSQNIGGTTFSVRSNVCHEFITQQGNLYSWKAVMWQRCYRNGVPFGGGTGGCRSQGWIYNVFSGTYGTGYNWKKNTGSYWQDSGKILGYTGTIGPNIWINASDLTGTVCYAGLDGHDYGCYETGENLSWGHWSQVH